MAFRVDLEALILALLEFSSLHGYEIAKRLKESGSPALNVGEGLLYPALHKLEKEGRICATWLPQEGKPARKVYALTEGGREELERKRVQWAEFTEAIAGVMERPRSAAEGA
jgi:DNA-binding PadR family transcriptional regulator